MELVKRKWENDDFNLFHNYLENLKDHKYHDFQIRIIPNITNIIGIRSPQLKKIAKEISKGNIESFLEIKPLSYEEKIIKGSLIGCIKDWKQMLKYLYEYADEIDNWAVCDSLVANLTLFSQYQEDGKIMVEWCLKNNKPFIIRLGVIILLDYYLNDDNYQYAIDKVLNIKNDHYYVKMGVAWLLSMAFVKYPQAIMEILDGRLDKFTHNKTISKICDSYRVSQEIKYQLKIKRLK